MAGLTNLFGGGDDRDDDLDDASIGVDGSADDLGVEAHADDAAEANASIDLGSDSLLGGDGGMSDQSDEGVS